MDWINQNKFRNWLIVVLLVINVLTVSILWMQTARTNEPQPPRQDARGSESVNLLRKALDLNERQTKHFDSRRASQLEQTKALNDRLAALKRQLSDELFSDHPDTILAQQQAKGIGELQANLEMMRFEYFRELLAVCTPEQKSRLRPIVTELFGRKPPKDEPQVKPPRNGQQGEAPPHDGAMKDKKDIPQVPQDDMPGPPSVDEKLAKMSERLELTADQATKIRAILSIIKEENERLRRRVNPDQNEIQNEKEKLRKKEDDLIMKALDENQKKEFSRMIMNRGK
jgi:Spy/CpxP family protein refolding chaperone